MEVELIHREHAIQNVLLFRLEYVLIELALRHVAELGLLLVLEVQSALILHYH